MRVKDLSIDGFGIFHDCRIQGLSPGLNIFAGHNESGKSTLHAFFRHVLLGFPGARHKKDLRYAPLRGGREGGSLWLVLDSGREVRLERHPGPHGGMVTISAPDGSSVNDMNFTSPAGGMTRELYRNVFAFSLNELQTFESLDSDEIRATLYSAGMGAGIRKLSAAEKFISSRKSELFKPRGQKMVINTLLKEFDTVNGKIATALDENRKFEQMSRTQQELREKITLIKRELREKRRRNTVLQLLLQIREQWSSLELINARLEELCMAVPEFPEDGLLRLERLDSMVSGITDQLEEKRSRLSVRQKEKDSLIIDRLLFSEKKTVTEAVSMLSLYIKAAERMPNLENSASVLALEISELCASLGQGWDVDRIRTVDRSMFTRDAIMKFRADMKEKRESLLRLQEACREKEERLEQAGREVQEAQQDLDIAGKEARRVRTTGYEVPCGEDGASSLPALPAGQDAYEEFRESFIKACDMHDRQHLLENRLNGFEMELEYSLAELDLQWDREYLRDFKTSPGITTWIREQQEEFQQVQAEIKILGSRLSSMELTEKDVINRMEEAREKLAELSGKPENILLPDLEQARQGMEALHDIEVSLLLLEERRKIAVDKIEGLEATARQSARALDHVDEGQPAGLSHIWFSLPLALCSAAAWYWLVVKNNLTLQGSAAAMLFLASAGLLFMHGIHKNRDRKTAADQIKSGHEEQSRRLQQEMEDLSACVKKTGNEIDKLKGSATLILEAAGISTDTIMKSGSIAHEIRTAAGELTTRIREHEKITRDRQTIKEELKRQGRSLQETEEERSHIREKLEITENRRDELETAWQSSLVSMHIDPGVSFSQMEIIMAGLESCRKDLVEIDRISMEIESCRAYVHSYLMRMEEFTGPGYLSEVPLPDAFERLRRLLDQMAGKQSRIKETEKKISIAQSRLGTAAKQAEHARITLEKYRERVHEAEKALDMISLRWDQWLNDCSFEKGLSPDMVLDAMAVMERILEKDAALRLINAQKEDAAETVNSFLAMTKELFTRLGRSIPSMSEIVSAAVQLQEELEQALGLHAGEMELEREIKALEEEISSIKYRMKKLTDERKELMNQAGVRSPGEFREKHRMFMEKERLLQEQTARMDTMKKLSAGHDLDAMLEKLGTRSIEDITAEVEELDDSIRTLQEEMETTNLRLGELGHRLSSLADSMELARLRQKQECLKEEIRRMCRRWSIYAVAEYLIDQAKKYFEKEKQPEVIRNASNFFRQMTSEQYAGIIAPPGLDEIYAITANNERIKPENLSRGTAEQLYLALRLGYITCRRGSTESMPVLMDDILVNFDPRRAEAAAGTIIKLAEEVQVIFLTCHPETVDIFQRISEDGNRPAVNIYNINQGTISLDQQA